jgi:hypothetical protein
VTETSPPEARSPEARRASFAHASEAELARILDYYQVRWEYEPRSFPILWTLEGKVVESFAPDFFLPDLDLYVELTTLKQTLVRKKNRKLRRLRELYPEIRIKLFYAKDFRALMLKYGKLALAAEMSGAGGQFGLPDAVHAVRAAASHASSALTEPSTDATPEGVGPPATGRHGSPRDGVALDPRPPMGAAARTQRPMRESARRRKRIGPTRSD